MQPERVNMKCPKCGGRTITEDVHTYLGQQLERKCIACGKRFVDPIASVAEEAAKPMPRSKSIGTCTVCNRPDMYLIRGMCGKDYQAWRKANAGKAAEAPVTESPWRSQLYNRSELAKHEAKQAAGIPFAFESEEPMPSAPSTEPILDPAESVESGQVRSGQVRSGQVRSGQVRSGQGAGT